MYNVLVFPGGTEIGLEIFKCLYQCKDIKLFSASENISNHAPYVFTNHFTIPSVDEENWLEKINEIIIANNISYIFPAHDDVIVAIAENQSKIMANFISSPLETCLITRSKSQTYELFKSLIPIPKSFNNPENIQEYPIFIKPDKGQGSQDTHIIKNAKQLKNFLENIGSDKKYLILEYLPSAEYTIDCFSDRDRGLLFCDARERIRTRSGISMNSRSVCNDIEIFTQYAQIIMKKLPLYGAWFFQVKKDKYGIYKLLEIAPRIPGTMALQRVKGINLPLLSLYEHQRIPLTIMTNSIDIEIDRALINRYKYNLSYRKVYVDLDDTLIINNKINTLLIRFLYQCLNNNISIILITKHSEDLQATLQKHRINGIFEEIIHLNSSDSKVNYISDTNSIFIDDSFSERQSVYKNLGIPTFDCSMIEILLDDKG
jgi:hypothetical protein